MPDYKKGKIYRLTCDDNNLFYYGSTCETLAQRKAIHKYLAKTKSGGNSYLLYEKGNVNIELVEEFPCENKNELHVRERFYILNNHCINHDIPASTPEEISKRAAARRAEKITCECGKIISRGAYKNHILTNKHIEWAEKSANTE